MPTIPDPDPASPAQLLSGRIITTLVALFLVFDASLKLVRAGPAVAASTALGLPEATIIPIGCLLLVCTVVYLVPKSSILGAVLLTAYMGGCVAIQVRAGGGAFPVVFAVAMGVLIWTGLVLREPRLGRLIAVHRW